MVTTNTATYYIRCNSINMTHFYRYFYEEFFQLNLRWIFLTDLKQNEKLEFPSVSSTDGNITTLFLGGLPAVAWCSWLVLSLLPNAAGILLGNSSSCSNFRSSDGLWVCLYKWSLISCFFFLYLDFFIVFLFIRVVFLSSGSHPVGRLK